MVRLRRGGCNARSAWQRIAWGGARLCERNPRIVHENEREPVKRAADVRDLRCRPRCGLESFSNRVPRVALAKPRSTLGYMLTRASRVAPTLYAHTRFARCAHTIRSHALRALHPHYAHTRFARLIPPEHAQDIREIIGPCVRFRLSFKPSPPWILGQGVEGR